MASFSCFRFLKLKKDLKHQKRHQYEASSTSIETDESMHSYSYLPSPTSGLSFFQISKSGIAAEIVDCTESFIIHKYFDSRSVTRSLKKTRTLEKVNFSITDESPSSLWASSAFENPFQDAETVSLPVEDRLYEPRIPLLPKKVLYKGKPVNMDLDNLLESLTDLSQSFKNSRSTINGEDRSIQDSQTDTNQYRSFDEPELIHRTNSLPEGATFSVQSPIYRNPHASIERSIEVQRQYHDTVRTTKTTVSEHGGSKPANDEFETIMRNGQLNFDPYRNPQEAHSPKEPKVTVADHNFDIFKPIQPTPPPIEATVAQSNSPIQKSMISLKQMEEKQVYSKPVFTTIPSQDSSIVESSASLDSNLLKPLEPGRGMTSKLSGNSLEIEDIMAHRPTVPEPLCRPHIHPEFMDESDYPPPIPPHQGPVSKEEIDKLLQTCEDVQNELKHFEEEQNFSDSEAQRIERAIFDISEHIALQEPVSKAQAEASEELLRTKLAEMIINLDSDQEGHVDERESYELLMTPIDVLKKKLENLENTLITEEEQRINAELEELTRNPQVDHFDEKKKALGRMSADLARMTPVIVNVRDQLTSLEGIVSEKSGSNGKKSTGEANRAAIWDIFKRITDEIETIHQLCEENKSVDTSQVVIDVLTKVSQHMSAIMTTVIEATVTPAPTPTLMTSVHSAPGKLETPGKSTPVSVTPGPNITSIPEEKAMEVLKIKKPQTRIQKTIRIPTPKASEPKETVKTCSSQGCSFERQDSTTSQASNSSRKTPPPVPPKPKVETQNLNLELVHKKNQATTKTIVMFLSETDSTTDSTMDLAASTIKLQKQLSLKGASQNAPLTRVSTDVAFEKPYETNETTLTFNLCLVNMSLSQYIFDETISMQMVCEESDAGNESDNTFALCHCSVETFTPEPPIFFENDEKSSFIYIPKTQLGFDRDSPVKTIMEKLRKEEVVTLKDFESIQATVTEEFIFKRKPAKLKVNAQISPEVFDKTEAAFSWNDLTVVVEKEPEAFGAKAILVESQFLEAMGYFSTDPQVRNAQMSTAFDRSCDSITQEVLVRSNHSLNGHAKVIKSAKISVSIIARSVHDVTAAFLEEVPWNEAHITLQTTEDFSEASSAKSNPLFNVIVSESQGEPVSHRSSQKSLANSEKTLSCQSLAVPSYVIKRGSTASITCELNSYLPENTPIMWFKGEEPIKMEQGKIDRISHDLLEVLVITKAELEDSDVYSLKVDNEVYPVAYLIVEEGITETPTTEKFLSPQQTLFVMEGRTSIISCQMDKPHLKLAWYRDRTPIQENDRILMETYDDGWYRLVISDTQLSDQGTYYAFHNENFTSITLVVEEQIDEREVTVSAMEDETDDEPNDYMVPPGSTATIACELENDEFEQKLVWQKDGVELKFRDDTKMEHVKNGMKHYLIIHNTTEKDSGTYSVKINDTEFRVAQITICEGSPMISGNRRKRISNNSLHSNH